MLRAKTILGCMLVFIMAVIPVVSVGAAAPMQTTTIDGAIKVCETATDNFTGETIVVCEVTLTGGGTKTIRLSVADAVTKGLAVLNGDGTVTIIATEGQVISIDESMLLTDPCVMSEDASQPISKILADYFCGDLGMSYDDVQALHESGFGFGEIAQACFMALKLEGTGTLCSDILYAKKSGNYDDLNLPDGVTVSNWGQLRKAVLDHGPKNSSNPGSVVSDSVRNNDAKGDKEKNNGHANEEHGKPTK